MILSLFPLQIDTYIYILFSVFSAPYWFQMKSKSTAFHILCKPDTDFISVQFALFAYIHFYHSCFWQLYRFTQQYISFAHLILIGCWIIYWHFAQCTRRNVMTVWTLFHKSGNVKIVKIMQKSQKLFDARGYNVTTVWTLFH